VAKLKAYKFVNPGVSKVVSPSVAAARKQTFALNRLGSTISGIGSVVKDIEDISIAQIKNDKLRERTERRRRRREADLAQEELIENKKQAKKKKPKLTKAALKIATGSLGWIEKFLAPIGQFLLYLGQLAITKEVLDWVSDENNQKKLADFLEKTHFVFDKIFGWAKGFTQNVLDGFAALTDPNGTFIERLGGVGTIMKGLIGLKYLMNPFSLITDILGLIDLLTGYDPKKPKKPKKTPNRPTKKNPSGANPDIDGPRGRPRVKTVTDQFGKAAGKQYKKILAEYGDDAARAYLNALQESGGNPTRALQKWKRLKLKKIVYKPTRFGRIGDFFGGLFDTGVQKGKDVVKSVSKSLKNLPSWAGEQYNNLSKSAQRGWERVVAAGESIGNTGKKWANAAGDKFRKGFDSLSAGTKRFFTEKVLNPLKPIIDPIGRKARSIGQGMIDMLMKIPGMDKAAEVLRKKGIAGFDAIAQAGSKLGKRAAAILPVVGGLVNLAFAYQRFSSGDSIGGLIEGTSGILDILGLFTGGGTSVLSMLMDGYMFVRDFVPQLQQNEERVIDAVGARGLKDGIDRILSKLPGIGEIVNTLTGGSLDNYGKEDQDDKKKQSKRAWWDFAGLFTGKKKEKETIKALPEEKQTEEIKKNQWWDFLDLFPNRKEKPQEMFIGGLVKGIGKAIGGVAKGIGSAVSGVVNTVGSLAQNPIIGTALSFIPGMQIPMAVINATSALSQGNIMGALSAGIGGLGAFANINTVNAISQPQWLQNLRFSGFGQGVANMYHSGLNAFNNLSAGFNNIMNSKVGSIAQDILGGNYLGALSTINPKIGNIATNILNGDYGSALSAFNPEIGAAVTRGMALVDSFRQDPMGLIAGIAEQNGMGGLLKAVTGLMSGADKMTAITQIASEMGIDPRVLGVVKKAHQQALSEGGISAQFAMDQAMEFIPIPVIIEKIVPIPEAISINSGGVVITASPSSILERMK